MKLQIISRLSQSQLNKLDTIPTQRRQNHDVCMKLSLDNSIKVNHQYASMRSTQRGNCQRQQKENNLRLFFANFDKNCKVRYIAETQQQPKHKRKLQSQLRSILASKPLKLDTTDDSQEKNYFNISKQQKQVQPRRSVLQNILQPREMRNYYLMQQKAKQKIRKISSLVSIKQEDSAIEAKRKPGFILKKNLSLNKEGFQERLSIMNIDNGRGKQNQNPNCPNYVSLRRNESKSNLQTVDDQISMSKQRIALIRKELNEIYQMRDPNRCRLKLF